MGKINVLSFEVANLIAAGEVVDRPSSVVKELIENSIDAGASKVTIEIKNGGVSYIRVSDDGCGIASEDLPLALKRHATSKISNASDLNAIFTLGFRGEALAAISSVSKVRILSKTADAQNGAMLYADGGIIESVSEAGCPNGTTITVEELFANVPARRKFLKKDATETAAVCAAVEKAALSHPEVSIRLIVDGNIRLESAGDGKLENAVYAVLGKDFARRILPVKCRNEGIDVYGYIGCSDNVKPTRNFQNFFINHRYVKSRTAMAALEQAFSSYIAPEKFPSCVLFIDLNPGAVDVNVHPAKLEVKFSNEKIIFDTVYYAVRSTIEKNTNRPELMLRSDTSSARTVSNAFVPMIERSERADSAPEQLRFNKQDEIAAAQRNHGSSENIRTDSAYIGKQTDAAPRFVPDVKVDIDVSALPVIDKQSEKPLVEQTADYETGKVDKLPVPEYRIVGIAFNTYIMVETEGKLVIIDKHAAHERILFEGMRGRIRNFTPSPQILLVPIVVDMSRGDFDAVNEYAEKFREIGFDFETDSTQSRVKISQIPSALKISDVETVFATMADRLANGTGNLEVTKQDAYEKALYQASCKAAMKGGRVDSESDLRFVVEKVLTIPDITVCPHGRPVVINLTKYSLDKQFGRE